MYSKFGQFIDGKWTASHDKSTYEVINPATEEVLGHASKATPTDVERALKSSEQGLQVWKKITPWQNDPQQLRFLILREFCIQSFECISLGMPFKYPPRPKNKACQGFSATV